MAAVVSRPCKRFLLASSRLLQWATRSVSCRSESSAAVRSSKARPIPATTIRWELFTAAGLPLFWVQQWESRAFKHQTTTLPTLAQIVEYCRNRASTRLALYRWLVFNLLVANGDNHLKNLSFLVSDEGIEFAPAYDLLSTASYQTRAFANERADWPTTHLAIPPAGRDDVRLVSRNSILSAGESLGLPGGSASVSSIGSHEICPPR